MPRFLTLTENLTESKPGGKKPFFRKIFIPPMGGMNAGPAVQRTGKTIYRGTGKFT
ncbi:hypothetical protein ES708_12702 [subsurface metagenome]